MTTISAHTATVRRAAAPITPFESAVLRAAGALNTFVSHRLARRADAAERDAAAAWDAAASARQSAEAHAAMGMIPR